MFWLNSQVQDLAYRWYIFGYWNGWLQWILHYGNWLHGWIVKVNVNQCQNVSVASFGTKVAVIIDCFKVFMECPSNLLARASTCFPTSTPKHWKGFVRHCTTMSCDVHLVTMGRMCQRQISYGMVWNIGHLLSGDVVLADWEIDRCRNDAGKASRPLIYKRGDQLSAMELDKTRTIPNVRIHDQLNHWECQTEVFYFLLFLTPPF